MVKPFLSVVIPAFNEETRISATLASVIDYLGAQEYTWKVVDVDDGSTDDTAAVCARFAVRCAPGALELRAVNQRLGAVLAKHGRVDLEQPEITVRVFQSDALELVLEREATGYRRCLEHHLNRRPRLAPVSLPPRLARAMNMPPFHKNSPLLTNFSAFPFSGFSAKFITL